MRAVRPGAGAGGGGGSTDVAGGAAGAGAASERGRKVRGLPAGGHCVRVTVPPTALSADPGRAKPPARARGAGGRDLLGARNALRADLGPAGCGSATRPLSTGRPGPSRVTPADRAEPLGEADRVPCRERWTWLRWRAPYGAMPGGPAAAVGARRSGRTSGGGPGRTYSPPTAACQQRLDLRGLTKSAGQRKAGESSTPSRRRTVRGHPPLTRHSFGRAKTVRPPTTVRSAVGSGSPGVRSGRPGVPERGSVDQLATRSSGACTTRSPACQTT